jgi:hypothetical protein
MEARIMSRKMAKLVMDQNAVKMDHTDLCDFLAKEIESSPDQATARSNMVPEDSIDSFLDTVEIQVPWSPSISLETSAHFGPGIKVENSSISKRVNIC